MSMILKDELLCFMIKNKGMGQKYCAYNSYDLRYSHYAFYRIVLLVISVSLLLESTP
jgi:hypothetical protein